MSSARASRARRPTIWSTASLRLAAGFSLFFGLGGAALIGGIDYGLMRFAEAEVRDGLTHQMQVMRADADRHGGAELVRELNAQPRNRDARRYLLLVSAPDGETFSNGLTRQAVNDTGFRHNLPTKARQRRWPDQAPNMLVLSARSTDGTLLAVGRDTQHLDELRGGIRGFAAVSGIALLALALLGGLTFGWLFLRRLETVNAVVARIIAGGESERLPAIGFGREFDDLASNLNRMLERQEASMTALKALSEGVAHELRAPLNRVRNRLEEVMSLADDEAGREEAIGLALEEMDQLNGLFEALLALARIETGSAQLSQEALDLSELMEMVGEIYRPVVEEAGGTLEIRVDAGVTGQGDASLLKQAVANLIENAVFHGGDPATIGLGVIATQDQAVLTVTDRGAGVPEAERERVTRRFHRLKEGRARPGAGLGLAMVAAVARAHDGELKLLDNEPGLRVELRLPSDQRLRGNETSPD